MRTHWFLLTAAAAVLGCAPASAQGGSRDVGYGGVPPQAYPPRGMCRVWLDGLSPSQQPPVTDCATAERAARFEEATGRKPTQRETAVLAQRATMKTRKGKAEGEAKGEIKGKATMLLQVLQVRFGTLPAELETAIHGSTDPNQLDRWGVAAATAATLDDFRLTAGL